ncbi:MAG: isocitrate/isopropylmalate family dehydrogenase, partial [Selenomonadaceae bacterium]
YSLREEAAAAAIEQAVEQALNDGYRTPDLCREGFKRADTEVMTRAIIERI